MIREERIFANLWGWFKENDGRDALSARGRDEMVKHLHQVVAPEE